MRLCVTSDMFNYSFRPELGEKLRLFREHGFGYLHWCDEWDTDRLYTPEETQEAVKATRDAGILTLDLHGTSTQRFRIDAPGEADHRGYVKLLENRIRLCEALGGDCVVFHPPRAGGGASEEEVARTLRALDGVKVLCRDTSVRLAVENCYTGDEAVLRRFFERYPPEFLGFCFDSGHANLHGNLDALEGFADRLIATHLHDNKGDADRHQAPFWGTVDWGRVTRWLRGAGYRKPLNFEVTYYPLISRGGMKEFLEETRSVAQRVTDAVGGG